MKKILVAISMLIVGSAFAGEIQVFDKSIYEIGYSNSIQPSFVINEELGRVWVEVDVADQDPDSLGSTYRVKIEGLSYDKATSSVLVEHEGEVVTCAVKRTYGRSVFKTERINMTNRCSFQGVWRKITYDDGFEMKQTEKYKIVLVIK
jgi:hypothetical protein